MPTSIKPPHRQYLHCTNHVTPSPPSNSQHRHYNLSPIPVKPQYRHHPHYINIPLHNLLQNPTTMTTPQTPSPNSKKTVRFSPTPQIFALPSNPLLTTTRAYRDPSNAALERMADEWRQATLAQERLHAARASAALAAETGARGASAGPKGAGTVRAAGRPLGEIVGWVPRAACATGSAGGGRGGDGRVRDAEGPVPWRRG
ncbi:uncharacterized protein BDZ99DRAFT_526412 [Mytilinidion resinicola]|uniref:Uncharacterized protein n=1 Tax=Mytilinidion resinicola TaxID=574789 RepID=A0A6A6Y4P2_9PEZI|nr:uncharacterized protein BDZ99DRAFT_526412 [Mytilinidion resinicola]KAF2803483.1 hypothetical protein BDZ99DRAFT_526412 [Mytilinidion resinicola]